MEHTLFHSGLVVKSPMLNCEEAVAYSVGWDAQVKQTHKRKQLLMQVSGFHTPHIQFGSTYYNTAFLVQGFNPVKTIVITYNKTKGIINYRNRRFEHNELLILTRDEELNLLISEENTTYTIAIDEEYFQQRFFDYYGMVFEGTIKKYLLLEPHKEESFLGFLQFWIDYFQINDTSNLKAQQYEKIEQSIIHTLFSFLTIDGYKPKSENNILKEARGLLEQNLESELKLSDTAKYLGVSQRTLEYTFKQNLGMTPKNYLQTLRLYAIRDELKHADPRATKVSDIALKYSFFHMGHFSLEYKKFFGESPLETLKSKMRTLDNSK